MFSNKLKLNPDKTEFMLIGNKCHRNKFTSVFPINLLGTDLSPSQYARNLGVTFDADFNFQRHINNVIKSCNYHMRDLRRIRKHLSDDVAVSLANALVSSRLDYCNSLLYGIPAKYISKFQRVQDSLARVVTRSTRFTTAAPLLEKLHWLPVRSRIRFKISLIIYKAIKFNKPSSLTKHISVRALPIGLRSTTVTTLNPGPFSRSYGSRAFSSYAPVVWNALPESVRHAPSIHSFRKLLKTHYFTHPP